MKEIYIYGAGGHGRVILDIVRNMGMKVGGFLDSDSKKHGKFVNNERVLGDLSIVSQLIKERECLFVVGVGDNKSRKEIYLEIKRRGGDIVNVIHPSAVVAKDVNLGEGIVIASGAIVCSSAAIGNNSIINTGSIIEHDNLIGEHVHISPGVTLAGGINIESGVWVGLGVTIIEHKTIGKNSKVGAGSVVIDNVPDNFLVAGVPAKVIKILK